MKIEKIVIRYRWLIIGLSILLVIGSVLPMLKMEINPDLASYMPASMPASVNQKKVDEIFGEREPLLIIFETEDVLNQSTLTRIKKLSQEFKRQKEFDQVISLFEIKNIRGEDGMMLVDPVVKRIPKTDEKREELRESIQGNSMAYGLVVSEDFRYTLMLLDVVAVNHDKEVMDLVFSLLDKYPGDETVRVSGQLYLRTEANEKISRDFIILLPIGILLMLLFLWISFREIKGLMLPFSVVVISILVSMGLIPLLGWELSIIGVLIPIMMIAIANNYGVHFIAKYQEIKSLRTDLNMQDIVTETTRYLIRPIVLTGLTTMVGIIGLVAHILIPAKQMGVVVTIGIGLALILSLTLIPAWMSMMKKGKGENSTTQVKSLPILDKLLTRIGKAITLHPRKVILFFIAFVVIAGLGLTRFRVASDFNNIMPKNHPFNEAIDIAGEHFGGTKSITVSFHGDIKDPKVLMAIDRYGMELEATPGVGNVSSLATIIKIMSKALNEPGEEGYDRIPDTRAAIAQYIELYTMSGDPEDFERFVDFSYENAIMNIQYQADNLDEIDLILDKIDQLTEDDPHVSGIAGYSLIEKELCEAIAVGQAYSLLFAFFAIMLLMMIIFRSFSAGLIGALPLLFSITCTFGLMGWLGIELDIVTALLSSISIGLGVDYTIHMFWRLRTEVRQGNSYKDAILVSLRTIGRGISINAFAVILGFSVLFFSGFPLIRSFAFLIIISLFLCLISSLMLIPAIVIIRKPIFFNK